MSMKSNHSHTLLRSVGLVLSSAAVLLTGCALQQTASEDTATGSSAVISGKAMGGQQPIYNATVTLYAAGNTDYGSAPTKLGASVSTDINGQFTFHPGAGVTYSCPAANSTTASQYLYIVASGGQPTTGVNNAYAAEMIALGNCATVLANNPQVVISEETTIASMAALQQFFTPLAAGLGNIGAPSTNLTGLANAMATANNLATNASGQSGVTTASGAVTGYTTNPVVTITPEISKVNLEADILASCINSNPSSSTNCSTLFSGVSAIAATDTLQAAYYMAANPTSSIGGTSNIAALFALASSNPPYTPTAAQPADWTLALNYSSASTQTIGTGATSFMYDPQYVAIDASGNVWMVNYGASGGTTGATTNSVSEISPAGTPLAQALTGANVLTGPAGISIDQTGNVWVPNYGSSSALGTSVSEYTAGGSTYSFTTNSGPQRIKIDGKGNVFVLEPSYKGPGDLEEIAAGSTPTLTPKATTLATGLTTDFSNLAIDSNYTIWITGGGTGALGGTSGYPALYQFLYSSSSPNYPATPSATTMAGGITAPENAISIDGSNNVFVTNYGTETLSELSGTTTITGAANSPYTVQSALTKPEFQAIDGAGNIWVTDAATAGNVFEIMNSPTPGIPAPPAAGFTHTYNEPYGIAIDGSGNVWVGSYNGALTEIVGAAIPAVVPLAAGLPTTPGGTSRLGKRP